jgi:hypothetical protein
MTLAGLTTKTKAEAATKKKKYFVDAYSDNFSLKLKYRHATKSKKE